MFIVNVKTEYDGLKWVHQRYVERCEAGETMGIRYNDQIMTITPKQLKNEPPLQSTESYIERHQREGEPRNKRYHIYGFIFEPDQKSLI